MIMITVVIAAEGLTAVGLAIGSLITSPEGFQLITTFVIFPLFFLSGALFPLENLPPYLTVLTIANPLTYIVDLLRSLLVGLQYFSTLENVVITISFAAIATLLGILAFRRMRA
jgi:ABC-2 type transport system permease protein